MLHIEADEELFNQWQFLARRVDSLAAIVQNDMTIPQNEFDEWLSWARMIDSQLSELTARTASHCQRFSGETVDRRELL